MKKIVITGATSFIGIHLIQEWLKKKGCKIYAIIRPDSPNKKRIPINKRICIIECAMENYDTLINQIKSADFFFHLAWEGARVPYRDDIAIQLNNYKCAIKAMESAENIGCRLFIGTGSQAEYGTTFGLVDEKYPCNPITVYGREKLHACKDLKKMSDRSGIRFIWIRIFSIYGKYVNNGELVPSARSNCTTLPKQEYHLAGLLYRSATALCQRCEPLFR